MNAAIEIQNLTIEFSRGRNKIRAVDGLSMQVESGQIFGFIGPNGAGKTTTIHALLGFIAPTSGVIRVFGGDARETLARSRIGYMPENPEIYRFLTGNEFLRMMGRLFDIPAKPLRRRSDELIETVGLTHAANRRIALYSRGMLQRLALAQALINDPELVVLDEPTGGFDPLGRIDIRRIIDDLRRRGRTVLFSSHELSEVEKVCDRVGIIVSGRMAASGSINELANKGESLEQYFIKLIK